jgi:3-phenylpropionate/cinnamic acid dioxygenase small subunit
VDDQSIAAIAADLALWLSVEAFQSREIALLQAGWYSEWLTLLAEDVRYWAPLVSSGGGREQVNGAEGELAWIDDRLPALTLRVRRLESGFAVEEAVPVRTRYFIQNLAITPRTPDRTEVGVVSNFLLYRTRLERQEAFFAGGREDVLRQVDGAWKLAYRKVILDQHVLGPNNRFSMFL